MSRAAWVGGAAGGANARGGLHGECQRRSVGISDGRLATSVTRRRVRCQRCIESETRSSHEWDGDGKDATKGARGVPKPLC